MLSLSRARRALVVLACLGAAHVACAAEAKKNWEEHCAKCHGSDGAANTKTGRKEKIKDLTTAKNQDRATDDRIMKSMLEGIKDNDGREQMPSFRGKLSEADMKALVSFIRTLKRS